jgi:formylglycine-generating enzyme required for sulfatase activity
MDREIRKFSAALAGADVGIFFYSGHGLQVSGTNYLVPVDAELSTADALDFEMVRLDLVQRVMENATKTNILFLDACRNNPLTRNLARALGTRAAGIGKGLAPAESSVGTLISFSTQPGNVALDGTGRNSPYTGPLVKRIGRTGEDVLTVLTDVRNEVLAATGDKQVPWENHALRGRFYFNPPGQAPAVPPAPTRFSEAAEAWDRAKDTTSVAVLEAFVVRYKDTFYADLARARIEELKRAQVAVATPPKAPPPAPAKPTQPAVAVPPPPSARCDGVEAPAGNEKRCLKPKDGFRDCPTCPEMIVVPAGDFTMGSPQNELDRYDQKEAQVRVTIAAPFAAGKYAVTFKEWDDCVADGGCNEYKPDDMGWGRGKHPVIKVNWEDAKAYATWLSQKTGKTYRLLSEAEREYVTRAGTATPFWWGASITPKQANFEGHYTYPYHGRTKGESRERTVPVDSFQPNPWGLYNVHGNVNEWTEDCWNGSNTGNPGDGRARTTGDCEIRVLRGGSWVNFPGETRSAMRRERIASERKEFIGFRLARTLAP